MKHPREHGEIHRFLFSFRGAPSGFEREPAAERIARERATLGSPTAPSPAAKAKAWLAGPSSGKSRLRHHLKPQKDVGFSPKSFFVKTARVAEKWLACVTCSTDRQTLALV
jgi:hypothetical protein